MALHVLVYPRNHNKVQIEGEWEDGRPFEEVVISREPNMTAAETVEYYFLEQGYVASWLWSQDCCGHLGAIHGQFVSAPLPGGKAYKEVTYSLAHLYDLDL